MQMFVSSRNRGSITAPCVFAVCPSPVLQSADLRATRPAGRMLAPGFLVFLAARSHLLAGRFPLLCSSTGTVSAAARPGCFPTGIPLPLPSKVLLNEYTPGIHTFVLLRNKCDSDSSRGAATGVGFQERFFSVFSISPAVPWYGSPGLSHSIEKYPL